MLLEVTNKLRVYEEAPLEVDCNNPEAQDSPVIEGIDENTGDVEEATDSDEIDSDGEDETGIRNDLAVQGMESLALSFMTQLAKAISLKSPETQDDDSQKTLVAKSSLTKRRIVLELADRNKAKGSDGRKPVRHLQYPRNSVNPSAKSMAQFFRVIDIAHDASVSRCAMTKRDLYYRDVSVFGTQSVVNRWVDDIAATLSLSRADLGIRASPKGLFCGAGLTIHFHDGCSVGGNDTEASLIPVTEDIARFELSGEISWILIVEKEAVFQTLSSASLTCHPSLPGPGILLTGKGYPDVATRQIIKTFSDNLPEDVPILVLVDADAYGLDIASVYKFGSLAMEHESGTLAAHRVEWIGVSCAEVVRMGLDRDALLPITEHDQRKALAMLRSDRYIPGKWRRELMHMLHTRRKAEIEVLSSLLSPRNTDELEQYEFRSKRQRTLSSTPLVQYVTNSINHILEGSA